MSAQNTEAPRNENESLTVKEVSREMSLCQRMIWKYIAANEIEYMRFGKAVRISRDAVRRFKESRTVKAKN